MKIPLLHYCFKRGGFPINRIERPQVAIFLALALLLAAGAAATSQISPTSALIFFTAVASSFLVIEMKIGPVTLFPVMSWLAFVSGGTISGILTSFAALAAGLWFYWKNKNIRFVFVSSIPVLVFFAATVPISRENGPGYLLLIPSGFLLQLVFMSLAGKRNVTPRSLAMIATTWLISGISAWIIRFFLLEDGFAGGLVVLFIMLITLVYDFRSRNRLKLHTDRIKTLSLQNKLVNSLYSNDDSLLLFLMDGLNVWTMHGKPAAIKVPQVPSITHRIEKQGEWSVVSTEKSIFIAGGEAAGELESLENQDLRETLELLENVWKASFSKKRLENAFLGAALMFVKLADRRDSDTHNHSVRVSQMAVKIAQVLGLPEAEVLQLRIGALLHDIGKLAVPGVLIMKKGLLTRLERNVIETHPEAGAKLLGVMPRYNEASEIVLQHHEHVNGTGYPQGLADNSISLGARIVAVADVFDAITSPRAYHMGKSDQNALLEIKKYRGTYFDANVVDALEVLLR